MILKPMDMARGNRRLFFDYGNRGHKRALQFFNDAPHSNDPISLAHAGNGFFMRRGYTVAWVAWEGDMLPGDGRMVLDVPVATDNGQPITGRVRVEFIPDGRAPRRMPLSGRVAAHSYPTVSLDTRDAVFTRRRYPYDEPEVIPHDQWCFAAGEVGARRRDRRRPSTRWFRRTGTSTTRRDSSRAGSTSWSTPPGTRR